MSTIEPGKDQLNGFILEKHGSFQQSWQWGELQERMGRPVRRFLFIEKDKPIAAATFVKHDLKFGRYYWLCPRGPVVEHSVIASDSEAISLMKGLLRHFVPRNDKNSIFIRIEPEEPINGQATEFVKSPKDHNPRATVIVDLNKTEDKLLAGMHPKTRYNLRLARKKGIKFIDSGSEAGMTDGFFELLEKTAKRDKFFLHPAKYYEELAKMEEVKLFGAYFQDRLVAAAMISVWGETATYLHGASDYEHRALMAPYLLHWDIMERLQNQGVKYYDFGGVSPEKEPGHFLAGVSRFKTGWGGKYVEYPGSWDYVIDTVWYKVYKLARHILSS